MKLTAGKILILICLALLIFSLQFTKYADYDLWWHLKLGEGIVQTGHIYDQDEFSYTFAGQHQTSSEWLSDLLLFLAFTTGGFLGISLLKAGIILLTLFFVFRTIMNHGSGDDQGFVAAVITLVVVLFSIRFRLFVRPYLFNYLFTAVFLYLLSVYEKKKEPKTLYLLPFVQLVWSNMYSAAIFGPMIFVFFVINKLIDKEQRKDALRYGSVLAAIIVATLISPETYHAYTILFRVASDPTLVNFGEFQPLSFKMIWGYGISYTFGYQILVAGSLVYFLFLKGWKNIFHVLLFVVFFAESVLHVRMIDVFSLVAAVFFSCALERLATRHITLKDPRITGTAIVVLLALIPLSLVGSKTYALGLGVKDNTFPEQAIAFLEKEGIKGRMFNSYAMGGYLIWRAPDRKVFIDGRYSRPYTPEFYNAYRTIIDKADAWNEADKQWGFDYALLEYDFQSQRFPFHLNTNPMWALVYWDSTAAIYLKRTPQNLPTIGKHEYLTVKPTFNDFEMLRHEFTSQRPDYAFAERINRDIMLNPANQEPRLAKVFVLFSMGRGYYREALEELKYTIELKPDLAIEHSAASFLLYQLGAKDDAKKELHRALELDPNDPQALKLKQFVFKD